MTRFPLVAILRLDTAINAAAALALAALAPALAPRIGLSTTRPLYAIAAAVAIGAFCHWLTARNPRPAPIRAMIAVDAILATTAITLAATNPTAAPTWAQIGLVGVATTALTMGALKHLGLRTRLA